MSKQPPYLVTQLTQDFWGIYRIEDRSDLVKKTMQSVLALAEGNAPEWMSFRYSLEPMCANRFEFEGKGVCGKQRAECVYRAREVGKCPILKEQMQNELERLEQKN